jgi:hypothetical protein
VSAAAVVAAERCLVELEVAYHHVEHLAVEIVAVAQPQELVALHRRDRPLPEHVSSSSQLGVEHLRELLGDQVGAGQG